MMDNLLDKLRSGDVEVRTTSRRSRKQKQREEDNASNDLSAADLLKSLTLED
jgi:hypothetical protein